MNNIQLTHHQHTPSGITLPLCFLAHDIEAPANVGSLFRIADALGVEKIYLTGGSPTPPNPKIKKTSRSTEKFIPWEYAENPVTVLEKLKQQNHRVVALEITSHSQDVRSHKVEPEEKLCLILGSENKGIDQDLLSRADVTLHIPMVGKNSSMNVATAAAIATFELSRERLG